MALVLAPLSCSKNKSWGEGLDPELSFVPVVGTLTREETSYTAYPESSTFGIWEASLEKGKTWSKNHSSAREDYVNTPVSYSAGIWAPSQNDKIEYGRSLNLIAYSPYGANVTIDPAKGIVIENFDIETDDSDIMFAGPVIDYDLSAVSGSVPLEFTDAFAQVAVYMYSTAKNYQVITVEEVTLSGLRTQGSFAQIPIPEWTVTGSAKDYEIYSGSQTMTTELAMVGNEWRVLPQKFDAVLTVKYNVEVNDEVTTKELSVSTPMKWRIGKRCVYVLGINTENIELIYNSEML